MARMELIHLVRPLVELYDLEADLGEVASLAIDRTKNTDLLMTMNGKLETPIKAEIAKDDGREMLDIAGITWGVDKVDL